MWVLYETYVNEHIVFGGGGENVGKTKEKRDTGNEASTCFIAPYVGEKY
jgi:hypothetical protein